jgi:hypothetical protein
MKKSLLIGVGVLILVVICGAWYTYTNPAISAGISAELGLHHAVSGGPGSNIASTTAYSHGMRGGFVTGSIEVLNGTGFTITLANGDTQNVTLAATTTIQNYATASTTPTTITADQLSVGEQVQIIGMSNSDGSITARIVRTGAVPARNAGGFGGGNRGGGTQSQPTSP